MEEVTKTENIKIDRFYNLIIEGEKDYGDSLFDIVDMLVKAKEEGRINSDETSILLKLILAKETKKEVQELSKWMQILGEKKDKYSMLLNLSSKEKKYA